jgi:hypothetical protein
MSVLLVGSVTDSIKEKLSNSDAKISVFVDTVQEFVDWSITNGKRNDISRIVVLPHAFSNKEDVVSQMEELKLNADTFCSDAFVTVLSSNIDTYDRLKNSKMFDGNNLEIDFIREIKISHIVSKSKEFPIQNDKSQSVSEVKTSVKPVEVVTEATDTSPSKEPEETPSEVVDAEKEIKTFDNPSDKPIKNSFVKAKAIISVVSVNPEAGASFVSKELCEYLNHKHVNACVNEGECKVLIRDIGYEKITAQLIQTLQKSSYVVAVVSPSLDLKKYVEEFKEASDNLGDKVIFVGNKFDEFTLGLPKDSLGVSVGELDCVINSLPSKAISKATWNNRTVMSMPEYMDLILSLLHPLADPLVKEFQNL